MIDIEQIIFECSLPGLYRSGDKWNARCIVCGDSKKTRSKKRFWILPSRRNIGKYTCKCFNCGYSASFSYFLKEFYPDIYKLYYKYKFKKKINRIEDQNLSEESKEKMNQLSNQIDRKEVSLLRIAQLPKDHIAHEYIDDRKIPQIWKKYLFYTDNFKKWANSKKTDKFKKVPDNDRRVVIPFYTIDRKIFAVAGRTLEDKEPKYLTIKFDEYHPKIFGLERVDFSKRVYIFEGQIDSLFIPNSLAMAGSISNAKKLLDYAPLENFVLIPDNEPRNKDVCNFIQSAIDIGFPISLLPKELKKYGKDINDYILNSTLTRRNIFDIINENITEGLQSSIKFKIWKKIR